MSLELLRKNRSYYELLEIRQDASDDEIKSAYRRLALKFHPDRKNAHERRLAELRFRLINEAYANLRTPEKRASYDRLLRGENDNIAAANSFWAQVLDIFKTPAGK